jgi:hypothetical protein
VNLISLHPSRRRAVRQPSLALERNINSTPIKSRGFLSNLQQTRTEKYLIFLKYIILKTLTKYPSQNI